VATQRPPAVTVTGGSDTARREDQLGRQMA